MATLAVVVVVLVVIAVASCVRRTSGSAILSDHGRERQLAELRALAEYRSDPPIQPW